MKKIVKIITIIMIIVIVICGIYYALNKNYFKKKKAVEDDEKITEKNIWSSRVQFIKKNQNE